MASLDDQLGWCITTKDYLNNLNKELVYVANQYNSSIDQLQQYNYINEWLPELKMLANDFESEVHNLIYYIENQHLEYVDKQSRLIQSYI